MENQSVIDQFRDLMKNTSSSAITTGGWVWPGSWYPHIGCPYCNRCPYCGRPYHTGPYGPYITWCSTPSGSQGCSCSTAQEPEKKE